MFQNHVQPIEVSWNLVNDFEFWFFHLFLKSCKLILFSYIFLKIWQIVARISSLQIVVPGKFRKLFSHTILFKLSFQTDPLQIWQIDSLDISFFKICLIFFVLFLQIIFLGGYGRIVKVIKVVGVINVVGVVGVIKVGSRFFVGHGGQPCMVTCIQKIWQMPKLGGKLDISWCAVHAHVKRTTEKIEMKIT